MRSCWLINDYCSKFLLWNGREVDISVEGKTLEKVSQINLLRRWSVNLVIVHVGVEVTLSKARTTDVLIVVR